MTPPPPTPPSNPSPSNSRPAKGPQSKPDLRFDIDALFEHLIDNLGHELAHEKDWNFHLRPRTKSEAELNRLASIADELSEEFIIEFQEETEEEINGKMVMGPALLTVVVEGALMPDEVKALAKRFQTLAEQRGLVYDGVASYEPMGDEDGAFGWLELEDARERLRMLSEEGLASNAPVLFVFAFATGEEEHADEIEQAMLAAGYVDVDSVEDEDGDGEEDEPTILIIGAIKGRNSEKELAAAYAKTAALGRTLDAELLGVQFAEPE